MVFTNTAGINAMQNDIAVWSYIIAYRDAATKNTIIVMSRVSIVLLSQSALQLIECHFQMLGAP